MGLNNIILPASLVSDLYKDNLVDSSAPQPAGDMVTSVSGLKKPAYLGNNKRQICLLVNYALEVYLPDNELNFLASILQACKLNLGDVAIVNWHTQQLSFAALREAVSCKYLLVFGLEPANIGLPDTPWFTVTTAHDCTIVYAPAAEELNGSHPESKTWKGKLWTCLKQVFAV